MKGIWAVVACMEKLPPHPITKEAQEYLKQMTDDEKELHEMAVEKLGSSYFLERTKGYLAWLARLPVNKKETSR